MPSQASITARPHVKAVRLNSAPWASAPLTDLIPVDAHPVAWIGHDRSMIGWGRALEWTFNGPDALADASAQWADFVDSAHVDAVPDAPSAPIAFGSFAFSPALSSSVLILPTIVLVDTGTGRWAITASTESEAPDPIPFLDAARIEAPEAPRGLKTAVGRMTQAEWTRSVNELAARLRVGAALKAVMTRDMRVLADNVFDERHLLARLSDLYPTTWRFAVDGLVGASPEMLASMRSGRLRSRVLAGTAAPGHGHDLLDSPKNMREHALAVDSVIDALAPFAPSLARPDHPFVLDLPNVAHLATDVEADLDGHGLLDVVAALHPTAAVCGTPRTQALRLLEELEQTRRGRYSGPVGWIDGAGDGEFCIALRCGRIEDGGHTLRIFAGGGIMPDSNPTAELAETRAKMAPLLDALGLDPHSNTSLPPRERPRIDEANTDAEPQDCLA